MIFYFTYVLKPDIRKRVLAVRPNLYCLRLINNHAILRLDILGDTGENTNVFIFLPHDRVLDIQNEPIYYWFTVDYAINFLRNRSIRVGRHSVDNVRIEINVLSYVVFFQRLPWCLLNLWKIKIQLYLRSSENFLQLEVVLLSYIYLLFLILHFF